MEAVNTQELGPVESGTQILKQGFLKGIPSSSGISMGPARIVHPETITLPTEKLPQSQIQGEIARLERAIFELNRDFTEVIEKVRMDAGGVAAIIESDVYILNDPQLNESLLRRISEGTHAEVAVIQEFDQQKNYFKYSKDELLRERIIEIDHVKKRLLSVLKQQTFYYGIAENAIIVAQSITPTDLIKFKDAGVLGIILEIGGIASHVSILARSFEIPSVIGVKDATQVIGDGNNVIVDGFSGDIVYNPKKTAISKFIIRRNEINERRARLGELVKLPSETLDGKKVKITVNVDNVEDMHSAQMVGAEGAGLVRTEMLIIAQGKIPDEETQLHWYKQIADSAYPHQVALRVFDIGSDKFSEGLPVHEFNPALGLRGIRFLLSRRDVFETQIKAILKSSRNKNVSIMLPMITSIEEVEKTRQVIEQCKKELDYYGIPYDKFIPLGIMIETPAAAMMAEKLAQSVDFFSIGTNDLTQYVLAADRTNELVSDIYDSFHPAVIKLLKNTIDAAAKYKKKVSLCGELAGHAAAIPLLVGLGIDELSVASSLVLELKNTIRKINYKQSLNLSHKILEMCSSDDILESLEKIRVSELG